MAKHLLTKARVSETKDGYVTMSLASPSARVGALVAKNSRRAIKVDHASWTVTLPVTQPSRRRFWTVIVAGILVLAGAFTLLTPSKAVTRATVKCLEPLRVGESLPKLRPISAELLGGVEALVVAAKCSKSKLRVTVDSVTRRVLSVETD